MLVAEFAVGQTILHSTLEAFPDIRIVHEQQYRTGDDGIRLLFRMSGVDVSPFETAVDADPTVTNRRRLAAIESASFYRVDVTEYGRARSTFPRWCDDDVVLLEAHATHDGWQLRMRFPDRETLLEYREAYTARGCSFFLLSLCRKTDGGDETALTATQRKTLVRAYELGYFDVPRGVSQSELAAELGISSQSVSERLRRGVSALIESTLHYD
ncbi:helix-turn-helix domain-containing protein [Halopiger djelfimassiliensis]|uniref:helix-turn-helix domain-containing protein n=1 Tax=Halopiger djelfimassiliensis TaxID=1293047 RepID=UPI00067834A5|nr:helix-turn-helix domain-containing protein [Halopiger djelfimassiliensis]